MLVVQWCGSVVITLLKGRGHCYVQSSLPPKQAECIRTCLDFIDNVLLI